MRQLILLGVLGGILLQNAGALAAAGVPGSSAYVADGLVAHWDGIDNTLTDGMRSHNASATTWSDLSGNGNDIALPACVTVEANALLSAAGLNKTTADYAVLAQLNGLACGPDDPPFTVEVVAQRVRWTIEGNYQNLQTVFRTPRGAIGYRKDHDQGFFFTYAQNTTTLGTKDWYPNAHAADVHTISADFGNSTASSGVRIDNGSPASLDLSGKYEPAWYGDFSLFGNLRADIRIHAIRVYNRVLTDAERTRNHWLDRTRFVDETIASDFPGAYRRVAYIESTGTQFIDTGYLPNPSTRLEAELQFSAGAADRSGSGSSPFGCANSNDTARFSMNFGGDLRYDNTFWTWFNTGSSSSAIKSVDIGEGRRPRVRNSHSPRRPAPLHTARRDCRRSRRQPRIRSMRWSSLAGTRRVW